MSNDPGPAPAPHHAPDAHLPPSAPAAGAPAAPQAPQANNPDVPSPRRLSPMGAVLSYLVPGLGQIAQGRTGKGVLFLLCIYTLFFYGVWLGTAEARVHGRTFRVSSNVYIPRTPPTPEKQANVGIDGAVNGFKYVITHPRPQIAAQFFVGVAAWPAIIQYRHAQEQIAQGKPDPDLLEGQITQLYKSAEDSPETAKESLAEANELEKQLRAQYHPVLGDFMREPTMQATNAVFNAGDKRLEIAWVFTVIAGVLNVMVIWDALAGPAYTSPEDAKRKAG